MIEDVGNLRLGLAELNVALWRENIIVSISGGVYFMRHFYSANKLVEVAINV